MTAVQKFLSILKLDFVSTIAKFIKSEF